MCYLETVIVLLLSEFIDFHVLRIFQNKRKKELNLFFIFFLLFLFFRKQMVFKNYNQTYLNVFSMFFFVITEKVLNIEENQSSKAHLQTAYYMQ